MASAYLPLIVFVGGVASHLLVFNRGERFLYPFRYLQVFLLGCTVTALVQSHYGHVPSGQAVASTATSAAVYLAGLYSSLVVYRLFFNPLNKIPGPYWMRLTRMAFVRRVGLGLKSYQVLQDLHQQYGQFVRIGPNDVSVTHADCVEVMSGIKSRCIKAPWYSGDYPATSMHTTRDRAQHDRRRRIWSPAFSDKALRGYETRIQKYTDLLIRKVGESNGEPMDMAKWFNLFSFDAMGDLGFDKSFNMLESGEMHWAIKLLSDGMALVGLGLPAWFVRVLISIPGLAAGHWKFNNYCSAQLDDRIRRSDKIDNPDITHNLLQSYLTADDATKRAQLPTLQADSKLIIVAGSDTTSTSLTFLFYHIATEPGLLQRLRDELDAHVKPGESITNQKIQEAPILNGSIHETLRLHPPVPSGIFRQTPPEGVHVADVYIPGGTTIQMPTYVMGHDPTLWVDPEAFIPERFSSRPDLILHKDAFGTFSHGPYNCIGKNLALMELRTLTSQLIRKFDVRLADGETGDDLVHKSADHFTLSPRPLRLCFTQRTV